MNQTQRNPSKNVYKYIDSAPGEASIHMPGFVAFEASDNVLRFIETINENRNIFVLAENANAYVLKNKEGYYVANIHPEVSKAEIEGIFRNKLTKHYKEIPEDVVIDHPEARGRAARKQHERVSPKTQPNPQLPQRKNFRRKQIPFGWSRSLFIMMCILAFIAFVLVLLTLQVYGYLPAWF